jgi:protein CpxP
MSSRLKSWLLLTGIFVVGIVTGAALTIGLAPHFRHAPAATHDMRASWMARLTEKLALTTDQQAKVQPILADAEGKLDALRRDQIERGSQIIKSADDQIATLLTPDQQVQLQKMESDRQKMFNGHMHSRGGQHEGSGGPPDGMHHHDWNGQTNAPSQPPPPR